MCCKKPAESLVEKRMESLQHLQRQQVYHYCGRHPSLRRYLWEMVGSRSCRVAGSQLKLQSVSCCTDVVSLTLTFSHTLTVQSFTPGAAAHIWLCESHSLGLRATQLSEIIVLLSHALASTHTHRHVTFVQSSRLFSCFISVTPLKYTCLCIMNTLCQSLVKSLNCLFTWKQV